MKCIECGHELKDGAIFCIRCGAMQVSMDGKPIANGNSQEWPTVEAQSGASGFRSSTEGALHSAQSKNPRSFKQAPKRNGGRIAVVIIVILALIAAIAFAVTQCAAPVTSGSGSAASLSASSATSDSSASSASTSSASASSASASSASASASSTAASSSAASDAAASDSSEASDSAASVPSVVETQPAPEPEPEPAPASEPEPAPASAPANDYYVLPDSSSYYYSYDELNSMSTYDLYIARNEIYARHGRMFNRSDLQEYFNSQAWYEPLYSPSQFDNMGQQLNDVELQNAKLMKEVEADKGSAYL